MSPAVRDVGAKGPMSRDNENQMKMDCRDNENQVQTGSRKEGREGKRRNRGLQWVSLFVKGARLV